MFTFGKIAADDGEFARQVERGGAERFGVESHHCSDSTRSCGGILVGADRNDKNSSNNHRHPQ